MRLNTPRSVVLGLIASTILLGACSRSHASPSTAMGLCRAALAHKTIANAAATTVGAVRTLGGGPGATPIAATAFHGAVASAPAAWCWVSNGANSWTAYAAGPRRQSIRVASYDGLASAPSGPPAIK